MNDIPEQAAMGWDKRRRTSYDTPRTRMRDVLPAIAAALALALANLAFGAVQPIAALTLSAGITAIAIVMLALAGPRGMTPGMLIRASPALSPAPALHLPCCSQRAACGPSAISRLAAAPRSQPAGAR